jgi:hypothetical protein
MARMGRRPLWMLSEPSALVRDLTETISFFNMDLGSQQCSELFNSEVRIPNDSAEKWFLERPARMNGHHRSSLRFGVNQDEMASLLPVLDESRALESSDHFPRSERRKLRHPRRE